MSTTTVQRPPLPSPFAALRHQLRYDLREQWRSPAAMVFTLILPIGFLLLFATGAPADARAGYVPTCIIIGVFSGSLTNLAITLTYLREYGMLKQRRLQPAPAASLLLSRIAAAGILTVFAAAVVGAAGWALYGAVPERAGLLLAAVVLGGLIGSGLGLIVSALIPSELAAMPIANAVTLPLLVLAGVFIPLQQLPDGLQTVAAWLPGFGVTELARASYGEAVASSGVWLNALAWTAVSLIIGLKVFRWTPAHRR